MNGFFVRFFLELLFFGILWERERKKKGKEKDEGSKRDRVRIKRIMYPKLKKKILIDVDCTFLPFFLRIIILFALFSSSSSNCNSIKVREREDKRRGRVRERTNKIRDECFGILLLKWRFCLSNWWPVYTSWVLL